MKSSGPPSSVSTLFPRLEVSYQYSFTMTSCTPLDMPHEFLHQEQDELRFKPLGTFCLGWSYRQAYLHFITFCNVANIFVYFYVKFTFNRGSWLCMYQKSCRKIYQLSGFTRFGHHIVVFGAEYFSKLNFYCILFNTFVFYVKFILR